MKKIFITGGAGFMDHIIIFTFEKGYIFFILDSFINSSDKSIEKLKLF